jgi:LDH2 family malate/lactate/ureidoglycolate dehydrogenase
MVLDMATTVVSYGTVKNYALQGKPMETGWMVNTATGEDIIDAKRAAEGLLLPIGGYKGSGLAVMLGLIAGPLNRAVFGRDVVDFNADRCERDQHRHFIRALDIARFLPLDDYKAEVDRHYRELKESKRLPGVDEIRMPASGAAPAARIACATACRSRRRWSRSSTRWRGSWGEDQLASANLI